MPGDTSADIVHYAGTGFPGNQAYNTAVQMTTYHTITSDDVNHAMKQQLHIASASNARGNKRLSFRAIDKVFVVESSTGQSMITPIKRTAIVFYNKIQI